ncbi:nuclear transport factor 2 family protein [Gordonia sp. TBRC 11910]|uniref:Nuclear transport factor 2 family protein n=1 Tax=Gordonia asplenii TaxID=2725283 RepID=A0A848L8W3_9ACTN|nr:nuclear transport factor 2 family protein [Gordonia asplenii]NMO05203.1 nuclear transport factor 2 family protein [Gordonia asplenii]
MTDHTDDTVALTQLILLERQSRDRNRWDVMARCLAPDAAIRLSWFTGSGADFVSASREMADRGQRSTHRMSPPVVDVRGARAVVEAGAAIELRDEFGGVEVDVTSYTRLLYRCAKRAGEWLIVGLDPVYERDTMIAVVPGQVPPLDHTQLAKHRASYRFLSYLLTTRGYPVDDGLYGDDQPDRVRLLYNEVHEWLAA